jgi:ATP-dependent Clp endopeptidase proteolytic subunit ClpP
VSGAVTDDEKTLARAARRAAETLHYYRLAEYYAAQTAKTTEEARAAAAEADIKTAQATEAAVELERITEKRRAEKATDRYNRVYVFNGAVGRETVNSCIAALTEWMRTPDVGREVEIVFNSPGGSVIDGMALFDFIQAVRRSGLTITTSTIGYAASMAGILLQAGDKRVMGSQSWLMIHEASFGAGGKIGEVEDTVDWVKRVQDRILDIFANRCQAAVNAPKRLSRRQIAARWRRKDWWISSDEALAFGLVDEVR